MSPQPPYFFMSSETELTKTAAYGQIFYSIKFKLLRFYRHLSLIFKFLQKIAFRGLKPFEHFWFIHHSVERQEDCYYKYNRDSYILSSGFNPTSISHHPLVLSNY
jgi:hypothetical protein